MKFIHILVLVTAVAAGCATAPSYTPPPAVGYDLEFDVSPRFTVDCPSGPSHRYLLHVVLKELHGDAPPRIISEQRQVFREGVPRELGLEPAYGEVRLSNEPSAYPMSTGKATIVVASTGECTRAEVDCSVFYSVWSPPREKPVWRLRNVMTVPFRTEKDRSG